MKSWPRLASRAPVWCAATLLALVPALGGAQTVAGAPQLDLPRTTLAIGMYRIEAQVASTPREREIGLMQRRQMPDHEGMLFIFEQPATQCFWMKNTLIPLTAAFVADDGSVINLADMQPHDEASHCSARPVRYVLEMNQGWFDARHLKAGQKLQGTIFTQNGRNPAPSSTGKQP